MNYTGCRRQVPRRFFRSHRVTSAKRRCRRKPGSPQSTVRINVLAACNSSDAAGSKPRCLRDAAVQHCCRRSSGDERDRLARAHGERACRVRALLAIGAVPTCDRATIFPSMRWIRQGSALFVNARAAIAAWQYDLNHRRLASPAESRCDCTNREHRRRSRVPSATRRFFAALSADARRPRAMYTYIPCSRPDQLPVSTRCRTISISRSSSAKTASRGRPRRRHQSARVAITSRPARSGAGAERFSRCGRTALLLREPQVYLPGPRHKRLDRRTSWWGAEGRLLDAWSLIGLVQYDFGTRSSIASTSGPATTRRREKW